MTTHLPQEGHLSLFSLGDQAPVVQLSRVGPVARVRIFAEGDFPVTACECGAEAAASDHRLNLCRRLEAFTVKRLVHKPYRDIYIYIYIPSGHKIEDLLASNEQVRDVDPRAVSCHVIWPHRLL